MIRRRRHLEERERVLGRQDGPGYLRRLTVFGGEEIESAAVLDAPVVGDKVQDVRDAPT